MTATKYSTVPQTPRKYIRNVSALANDLADALHCVIAHRATKAPVAAGWRERPATAEEVDAAIGNPDRGVGFIPGRSGLLVIDIDVGKGRDVEKLAREVEASLGKPIDTFATPSGGIHLLYRCDTPVPDGKWAGGDVKCSSGHVMLWNLYGILTASESLEEVQAVDTTAWPIRKKQAAPSKDRRPHRRASRPSESFRNSMIGCLGYLDCKQASYHDWLYVGMGLHQCEQHGLIEDGLAMWGRVEPDRSGTLP